MKRLLVFSSTRVAAPPAALECHDAGVRTVLALQREQQAAIVYLLKENRVLKARLRGRKLRLTDDERRRLTLKGKALGRKLLAEVAGIVTPVLALFTVGDVYASLWVLPPSSVAEMTLRLYGALNYSPNSARDLRCALNGA